MTENALAIVLSRLQVFDNPVERLEQYPTPSSIAAHVLMRMFRQGLIRMCHVYDLGCGTGILGLGALLLGAGKVTMLDVDEAALVQARKNYQWLIEEGFLDNQDAAVFERGDVIGAQGVGDVVVMNPPFGTRTKHADTAFLDAAAGMSDMIISMHKSSTMRHIHKWADRKAFTVQWEERVVYPIAASYAHHSRRLHPVDVTVVCLCREEV